MVLPSRGGGSADCDMNGDGASLCCPLPTPRMRWRRSSVATATPAERSPVPTSSAGTSSDSNTGPWPQAATAVRACVYDPKARQIHHRRPEHCGHTRPSPTGGLTYSPVTHSFVIAGAADHSRVIPNLGQTRQGDGWCLTAPMRGLLSWSNFFSVPSRDTTAAQVRAATLNLDVRAVDSPLTGQTLPGRLRAIALAGPSVAVPPGRVNRGD
jgi:hypothetical protein